jgi:hypothetical protein
LEEGILLLEQATSLDERKKFEGSFCFSLFKKYQILKILTFQPNHFSTTFFLLLIEALAMYEKGLEKFLTAYQSITLLFVFCEIFENCAKIDSLSPNRLLVSDIEKRNQTKNEYIFKTSRTIESNYLQYDAY